MKLPASVKKKARIEIIPMIDTMFFLLVFFMIATLSMTIQHGMPVTLPTAESSTDKVPDQISLTLTREGTLYYNKERGIVAFKVSSAEIWTIDTDKMQ